MAPSRYLRCTCGSSCLSSWRLYLRCAFFPEMLHCGVAYTIVVGLGKPYQHTWDISNPIRLYRYPMGKSWLVFGCADSNPDRCGEPNMYMFPYKCMVTGSTSTTPLGKPVPPVWCENDQSKCISGPKQMLYWHQADGNNIDVNGWDVSGSPKSPGYNAKCGFKHGTFLNKPFRETLRW